MAPTVTLALLFAVEIISLSAMNSHLQNMGCSACSRYRSMAVIIQETSKFLLSGITNMIKIQLAQFTVLQSDNAFVAGCEVCARTVGVTKLLIHKNPQITIWRGAFGSVCYIAFHRIFLSFQAFFQGKLKISGNMGMAMKLQNLQLQPGKAKL